MPTRRPERDQCLRHSPVNACLAIMLAGSALAIGALIYAAIAISSLPARIGPPSRELPWYEAVPLELYLGARQADLQASSSSQEPFHFQVAEGDTVSEVASRLHAEGHLSDPLLFRLYLRYSGGDHHMTPGVYGLPAGLSARAIADAFASGNGRLRPLTVLPGWRAEEITAALASAGLAVSPSDFLEALRRRPGNLGLYASIPPQASLEGFLFPDQYLVDPNSNGDLLVFQMASDFDDHLGASLRSDFARQGLTVYQAVILASIVQREVVVASEMTVVASVLLNRLARGMPLQADATVQYAVGYDALSNTWWKNPLNPGDLKTASPYNTYMHNGLPPSPIDNPGLQALESVADPAQTNYLYFRAACDGSGRHVFSQTYQEHLAAACP
jgi:UPF0755 protein